MKITQHLELDWPTTDDWFPCFPRSTVRVRVSTLRDGCVRVSFWGADDFGLERDIPNATPQIIADQITWVRQLPNPVTQKWLRAQGFVNA